MVYEMIINIGVEAKTPEEAWQFADEYRATAEKNLTAVCTEHLIKHGKLANETIIEHA